MIAQQRGAVLLQCAAQVHVKVVLGRWWHGVERSDAHKKLLLDESTAVVRQ